MQSLILRKFDDWHVHLREGAMLVAVLPHTAAYARRALLMPNLANGRIATVADVRDYQREVEGAMRATGTKYFTPYYTIRLTPQTTPEMLVAAKEAKVMAAKLYPDGVTNASENGISDFAAIDDQLSCLQEIGLVLSVHAELPGVSELEAEAKFIPILAGWIKKFPNLKIVIEHLTTRAMVDFVLEQRSGKIGATITAQHLVLTYDQVYEGARLAYPHNYCKPVAKTADDQIALVRAAISGDPRFWYGGDTAPHLRSLKECANPKAGVYSALVAGSVLANIFDLAGCLATRLENYTSGFGADYYGEPRNTEMIALEKRPYKVPAICPGEVVPFLAGQTLPWELVPV